MHTHHKWYTTSCNTQKLWNFIHNSTFASPKHSSATKNWTNTIFSEAIRSEGITGRLPQICNSDSQFQWFSAIELHLQISKPNTLATQYVIAIVPHGNLCSIYIAHFLFWSKLAWNIWSSSAHLWPAFGSNCGIRIISSRRQKLFEVFLFDAKYGSHSRQL